MAVNNIEQIKALFESIGIKDKALTATLANAALTQNLHQLLVNNNVTPDKGLPKEVGALLQEISNPTTFPEKAAKHRNTLAQLIISGKMKRLNLKAALKILNEKGDADLESNFESQCGIGVVVGKEAVATHIGSVLDSNLTVLKEKGYNAVSEMFEKAKNLPELQWADGKLLNQVMDEELAKRIGPRPQKQQKAKKEEQVKKTEKEVVETFSNELGEAQLDAIQYREMRMQLIKKLKEEKNPDPYPHKFQITIELNSFRTKYDSLKPDEQLKDLVQVAGRVVFKRASSKKLVFYKIDGDNTSIQILANFTVYENHDEFNRLNEILRRGDIIGVIGHPARSKTGELSLVPKKMQLLSPCLHNLPHPGHLENQETRYRNRYLDLLTNEGVAHTFRMRAKIVKFIRKFFDDRGFLEVETPTMNLLAGGATAKPFITYHNDLGVPLFMRVAPELFLKQLIIGGLEKVYEIGKSYRNEGIDLTHNPEFTSIESYWAYADYEDVMKMTEELLSSMVKELTGGYKVKYHYEGKENKDKCYEIDFTPPYKRIPMVETLEEKLKVKFPTDLTSDETTKFLKEQCALHKIECSPPLTTARLLDKLVGEFIECDLISPSFITDHPQIMSPLAKWHRSKPGMTERFELFVAKRELCNAYTELNDPVLQKELFSGQVKDRDAGDDEAQPIDEGFCTALEHGLPPTGGWGMGIDRLCMFLTDQNNIKEVILFPAMKPLDTERAAQQQQLKFANIPASANLVSDILQPTK